MKEVRILINRKRTDGLDFYVRGRRLMLFNGLLNEKKVSKILFIIIIFENVMFSLFLEETRREIP